MTNFYLDNKKVLVTGASRGIGKGISIQLSYANAKLCITARNSSNLNDTYLSLKGKGHKQIITDLSREHEIEELVQELPKLDGIVLNAGILKTSPVKYLKLEDLDEIININIKSNVLLIKFLLKYKKIESGASICAISSIATQKPYIGNSAYSLTKGALSTFCKNLALELAPKKIRVNVILPGYIHTELSNNGKLSKKQIKSNSSKYPLGRVGHPNDVAHLTQFLLSDASNWMTGSEIKLDGGYTLI